MTSDAKVGLLLGLVFIFIIAFVINGLPSLKRGQNNSELTMKMIGSDSLGLAANERKAQGVFERRPAISQQYAAEIQQEPVQAQEDIRFSTPLANITASAKEAPQVQTIIDNPSNQMSERAIPTVYVVTEGDSLSTIAQKVYGAEEGNKLANIARIFEANRRQLKSLDEIYIGQKLAIPPLTASKQEASKSEGVFSANVFEKVKSIGERHLTAEKPKVQKGVYYTVQEDDSLWRIAAKCLGDPSRYAEIAKLNSDILEDEDSLCIGMRLKMP